MRTCFTTASYWPAASGWKSSSARALGLIASPIAVKPLIKALETDKDDTVRMSCVEALGSIGDKSALDSLKAALTSKNARLKCMAAASLGKLGSADGAEAALSESANADPKVRVAAIEALGDIGKMDEAAVKAIRQALKDTDASVVRVAETSRIKLGIEPEPVIQKEEPKKETTPKPAKGKTGQ